MKHLLTALAFILFFAFSFADAQVLVRRAIYPAAGGSSIAYGAQTRGDSTSTSSLSFSSPSVSGSNTLGVAIVGINDASVTATGITWNGSAMTEVAGAFNDLSGAFRLQIFYIIAPAAGSTTVAVTGSGTWAGIYVDAAYYTGVHQTTPVDTSGMGQGASSTSYSPTATTNNANEYVLAQAVLLNPCSIPAAAGPAVSSSSGCNGNYSWRSVYMPVASASTPTFSWTVGSANDWFWNWVSIKPA